MKKQWLAMLIAAVLLFTFTVSASANIEYTDNGGHLLIYDDADVLSDDEETALQEQLESVSALHGADIIVVTMPYLSDDILVEADNYYDSRTYFREDAALLMHCPAEREWYVSTVGAGIDALSDWDIEYIGESIVPYLQSDDFLGAYMAYAAVCDELFAEYEAAGGASENSGPQPVWWLVISATIGFVVALISVGVMKGKLKTVRVQVAAANYVRANSMNLTGQQDIFLYRKVDRQPKPKDNSSSTHRSAAGKIHGGGGGKY